MLNSYKGFKGCDDVLLPDIAMKLLTYNASLEIRNYQKYLSHELISSMVSEFFHKKGWARREYILVLSALLMEAVYNYDRMNPTAQMDNNIKDIVKRTRDNALYQSIVAAANLSFSWGRKSLEIY